VTSGYYTVDLDKANILKEGADVTIAAFSYMVVEALQAAEVLKDVGVGLEVIDMRSARPLDTNTVLHSLEKTGRLVVADTGYTTNSVAAELMAKTIEDGFSHYKMAPVRVASPDYPVPTSHYMAKNYYPEAADIAKAALKLSGYNDPETVEMVEKSLTRRSARDVPNPEFKGPF
jgi:pyruvate dehydrogenase E1 component beta subunit